MTRRDLPPVEYDHGRCRACGHAEQAEAGMSHSQVFAVLAVVSALHYIGSGSTAIGLLSTVCVLAMVLVAISERRKK